MGCTFLKSGGMEEADSKSNECWQCQLCGARVTGVARRSAHMRNIWLPSSDPRRCDNRIEQIPVITARATAIRAPVTSAPLTLLARRKPTSAADEMILRQSYSVGPTTINTSNCVDMCRVQDLWVAYLREIRAIASDAFWNVFLSMHTCAATQVDACLQAIRREFVSNRKEQQQFPGSRRALLNKIKDLPDFWSNVLHTQQVGVSIDNICVSTVTSIDVSFVGICVCTEIIIGASIDNICVSTASSIDVSIDGICVSTEIIIGVSIYGVCVSIDNICVSTASSIDVSIDGICVSTEMIIGVSIYGVCVSTELIIDVSIDGICVSTEMIIGVSIDSICVSTDIIPLNRLAWNSSGYQVELRQWNSSLSTRCGLG